MLDATRISDGRQVLLKLIPDDSEHDYEREMLVHLSSPHLRSDPRNRTVELLDVVKLPNSGQIALVMPLLRWFNNPRFQTVGEAVDFFSQIFEVCGQRITVLPIFIRQL